MVLTQEEILHQINIKINQLSISKLEDLATELLEITEINQLENW
ncbi:MAG: DUF4351 domain-containing protein [Dolichospermum sp.]